MGNGLWRVLKALRFHVWRIKRSALLPYTLRRVARGVETIHAPARPPRTEADVVVVAPVRNGEDHIADFIEYYRTLGASEIVLLDNGSTDRTVELARNFEGVTVLRCPLPFAKYSLAMRRYLVEGFGDGGWCLLTDIDERFDYPFSETLPLRGFLQYLNGRGYTAVMALMLDLFPAGPFPSWPAGGRRLIEDSVWYDLTNLTPFRPRRIIRSNRYADPDLPHFMGGIRKKVLGVNPCLTKTPLLLSKRGKGPLLESAHFVRGACIADVSCIIRHYKFDAEFRDRCVRVAREGTHFMNSVEYRSYLRALQNDPQLTLWSADAQRYSSTSALIDQWTVRVSHAYRQFNANWAGRSRTADEGTAN